MAFFESEFWHPSVAADIVLFTIRNKRLSVLLVKRKDNQMWALPGGFLTKGESLNECAIRELKEETGIEVPFLRQFEKHRKHENISWGFPRGFLIQFVFFLR